MDYYFDNLNNYDGLYLLIRGILYKLLVLFLWMWYM